MNYLAHAYLSFGISGVLTGNMISDFVKGRAQYNYPPEIFRGITLHRAIDEYTDFHPVTQEAKAFFRPVYRLYSGAFIDIVYDHFLANDLNEFADSRELLKFTEDTYLLLAENMHQFPERFATMFPYMRTHNWLYNYRHNEGLQRSFGGLTHRARYLTESERAFAIFLDNYTALRNHYESFFPELKQFAINWLKEHP